MGFLNTISINTLAFIRRHLGINFHVVLSFLSKSVLLFIIYLFSFLIRSTSLKSLFKGISI